MKREILNLNHTIFVMELFLLKVTATTTAAAATINDKTATVVIIIFLQSPVFWSSYFFLLPEQSQLLQFAITSMSSSLNLEWFSLQ